MYTDTFFSLTDKSIYIRYSILSFVHSEEDRWTIETAVSGSSINVVQIRFSFLGFLVF